MFPSMATDAPTPLLSVSWRWALSWVRSRVAGWLSLSRAWPSARFAAFAAALLLFAPIAPAADLRAAPSWTDHLEATEPAMPPSWTTVSGPFLRVSGPPDHLDTLIRIADHGAEALPRLSDALDLPVGGTVHVYIVDSQEAFRQLQPGAAPLWADATAYPALGAIYLRDPSVRDGTAKPLEQVFEHELVHILLGRAFAPTVPPSWLQEGVAQVLAGEAGPEVAAQIRDGIAQGGLLPLDHLESGFPRDANRARLAYAESADFVAWLQARHGPGVVSGLIAATRGGAEMPAAVRAVTSELLDDVEAEWSARFPSRLTLTGVNLLGDTFLLGMGGVLLAVGGVMRKRRFHQRMEALAREEARIDALAARLASRRHGPPPSKGAAMPGSWTSTP